MFKRFDEDKFKRDLLSNGIEGVEIVDAPEVALLLFYSIFNALMNKLAPI